MECPTMCPWCGEIVELHHMHRVGERYLVCEGQRLHDARQERLESERKEREKLIRDRDQLLAACRAAERILRAYIPPDQFDGHASAALKMVRDAIALAEGKE